MNERDGLTWAYEQPGRQKIEYILCPEIEDYTTALIKIDAKIDADWLDETKQNNIIDLNTDLLNMQVIEQIKAELQAQKVMYYLTTTSKERQDAAKEKYNAAQKEQVSLFSGKKVVRKNYARVIEAIRKEQARDKALVGIWSVPRFAKAHGNILCRPHGATEQAILTETGMDIYIVPMLSR